MSDYTIRMLAAACAPRISAKVEAAVIETVRAELPGIIEEVLREQYPGETLRLYVPKRSVSSRRDRNNAIRAQFTGHNTLALAKQFGISPRSVFRIVSGRM